MNNSVEHAEGAPTQAAVAEAAVWLARLMRPNRTPDVEEGFQRWLRERPEHAAAFEHTQDAWDANAGVVRRVVRPHMDWPPAVRTKRSRWPLFVAALTTVLLMAVGVAVLIHSGRLATDIGERRTRTLVDGTRVSLNTDTKLVIEYSARERRVRLLRGEAMFEVAKRPEHPFVVVAGDHVVRAVGTAFVVRNDPVQWSVTLVEGRVSVQSSADAQDVESVTELKPGERLTFLDRTTPQVDAPSLEALTAWQQGEVRLDGTPLADAVAEMNRYSVTQLEIEDPETAAVQVTGIFQAGDSASFARAVAHTYYLQVSEEPRRLVLKGRPLGASN